MDALIRAKTRHSLCECILSLQTSGNSRAEQKCAR